MTILNITIIQDDIEKGKPRDPFNDPIALAARREIEAQGIECTVQSGVSYIFFTRPDTKVKAIFLPEKALEFMRCFDDGLSEYIKPFTFIIEIPDSFLII